MNAPERSLVVGIARSARRFYAKALSQAERVRLDEAMQVEGIDQEIALLRLRLLQAIEERPEDIELMLKGTALLARLLATRYGLSKGDSDELTAAIERAAESLKAMEGEAVDA
jgi:hypothetical protein